MDDSRLRWLLATPSSTEHALRLAHACRSRPHVHRLLLLRHAADGGGPFAGLAALPEEALLHVLAALFTRVIAFSNPSVSTATTASPASRMTSPRSNASRSSTVNRRNT